MLAANVIGYVGLDGEGLAGIEHSFDTLRARPRGKGHAPARRAPRHVSRRRRRGEPPHRRQRRRPDHRLRRAVHRRARPRRSAVDKYHAAGGSAIVMDPRDGSILAMASRPTFDPNRFGDFSPAAWRNRNVQDIYEPGSTFKIVTASAGLEEGIVTPSQILDCGNGSIQIGNISIHEHGDNRYGLITFEDVMVHSSNVGAIRVGLALGQERFYQLHPPLRLRRAHRHAAAGRSAGPACGAPRSGRRCRTPRCRSGRRSASRRCRSSPPSRRSRTAACASRRASSTASSTRTATRLRPPQRAPVRVISEKTAAVLNEILKAVVARGTGQQAALAEHVVAGKTGTAQKAATRRLFGRQVRGLVRRLRSRRPAAAGDPGRRRRAERGAVRRHDRRAGVQGDRRVDAPLPRRAALDSVADARRRRAAAGRVFASRRRRAGAGSPRPARTRCARRDRPRDVGRLPRPRHRERRGPNTTTVARRSLADDSSDADARGGAR